MYSYSGINELIGTEVFIKHENYQPINAFKVRGGINLISQLEDEEKKNGVIAVSTGNHGQSVAYAAKLFGINATIVIPENSNPGKVASMQGLGAEVLFHGKNFDEAKIYCEKLVKERNMRYIHSGNEPELISGVGTYALEMLEDKPDLDVIFIPVGGGSGAAGTCIAAKTIKPNIRIIGVQSEESPAAFLSWQNKSLVNAKNNTFAEGLATGTAFDLPQRILWEYLDDFILVSDNSIMQAMFFAIERTHSLVEGAGAASLAGAYKLRSQLQEKKVGIVFSGGNTSLEHLKMALETLPYYIKTTK